MRKHTKTARKIVSIVLTLVMLIGMMTVGFMSSAAVQKNPPAWDRAKSYPQGTQVSYNGNVYEASMYMDAGKIPDGKVPDNTWTPYWKLVGPCPYPVDFAGDDGSVKLSEVKMSAQASAGREYIGFGLAENVAGDNGLLRNFDSIGNQGVQMLKPNTTYVVYLQLFDGEHWYVGSKDDDCALIKVNENGSVRIEPTGWGYNGLVECDTLNYKIVAKAGGFNLKYVPDQPIQEIYAKDMYSDKKPYGEGVDDDTLNEWATIGVNVGAGRGTSGKLLEGSARQCFNVNYLEDMVVLLNTPARSKSPEFTSAEVLDYYAKAKADNAAYMDHYTYNGSQYYLHDVYCQGVWDTMPAVYGWEQDEYTEPGLIIKTLHPEIDGLAYGLASGGQNPWVLCDYLERNAGYYDYKANKKVEGTNSGAGWYKGYDEVSQVPYLWQPEHGIFLAYENFESLSARCEYINKEGIAGCIIWELSGDNTDFYPMISHMRSELNPGKKILGYFTNWSVYNQYHQYQKPEVLPLDMMDFVNYSFFQVGGFYERGIEAPADCLNSMDRWADDYTGVDAKEKAPNMIPKFAELKQQYPNFKLLISVGGWTRGDGFNAMVNDASRRATFVNSVKEFMNQYPFFDGIDLDWEYAGSDRLPDFDDPNDLGSPGNKELNFQTYTDLCTDLRTMLDANFMGRNYLTACSPVAPGNALKQDLKNIAKQCSFINIMTYDYHGAFDPTIGYNSPLYAHPETPDEWSTENTVNFYKNDMQVPMDKINIGTPFYSRGWAGVKSDADGNPRPLLDPTPIFPSSTSTVVNPTGITVNPTSIEMNVGETKTITATVTPANADNKSVAWTSGNTAVATVDQNGNVKAIGEGKTVITARTANGLTAACDVTVKSAGTTDPEIPDIIKDCIFTVAKADSRIALQHFFGTDEVKELESETIIKDNVTLVPLRVLQDQLFVGIDWIEDKKQIVAHYTGYHVTMTLGETYYEVAADGNNFVFASGNLSAAPEILGDNKTYLPLRDVTGFGEFDEETGRLIKYVKNSYGEYIVFIIDGRDTISKSEAQIEAMVEYARGFIG